MHVHLKKYACTFENICMYMTESGSMYVDDIQGIYARMEEHDLVFFFV